MSSRRFFISFTVLLAVAFHPQLFANSWENTELSGYLSFEYEKNIGGDDEGDLNGSFDLDLIDLVFNFQLTERLRVATDITWEHGAATEDGRGNVAIEYGFAEYTYANSLRIRAGKMFTHFGIYNEIHTAKPATLSVKEPLATNKNNKFGSDIRFYPRWLTGIAIQGDSTIFDDIPINYDLQLSNGESLDEGDNPFEEDNNNHKALNGRIRVDIKDNFRLGLSFYKDTMLDEVGTGSLEINSYGFQMEWMTEFDLGVELEYVIGNVNEINVVDIDRSAYTIMFYYPFSETITPYFRYESLEPNKDISDDSATLYVTGINFEVDTNMYLKFEINNVTTEINNSKFNGNDWSEFKLSLSIGF